MSVIVTHIYFYFWNFTHVYNISWLYPFPLSIPGPLFTCLPSHLFALCWRYNSMSPLVPTRTGMWGLALGHGQSAMDHISRENGSSLTKQSSSASCTSGGAGVVGAPAVLHPSWNVDGLLSSWAHLFMVLFPVLWLFFFLSFFPLFCDVSWALGGRLI